MAILTTYPRFRKESTLNTAVQSMKEIREVIHAARPGDKLEVVFADKTFGDDLKGRLYFILAMMPPAGNALGISEMGMMALKAIADSGKWEGRRKYTFTVLDDFDADYFAHRTIGRELIESVNKVD